MSVWQKIDGLLEQYDGDLKIETASDCAWSGQLRLTLTNPIGRPSRSIVFYSVGGSDPRDVAERLLADVREWLATGAIEPIGSEGYRFPNAPTIETEPAMKS